MTTIEQLEATVRQLGRQLIQREEEVTRRETEVERREEQAAKREDQLEPKIRDQGNFKALRPGDILKCNMQGMKGGGPMFAHYDYNRNVLISEEDEERTFTSTSDFAQYVMDYKSARGPELCKVWKKVDGNFIWVKYSNVRDAFEQDD